MKEEPTAFSRFVTTLDDGRAHAAFTDELSTLIKKMTDDAYGSGGTSKGELSIKLRFKVEPSGVVGIAYEAKRKDPARRVTPGVMWINKNHQLVAENPRQGSLPGIREVPRARDEVIDVETGEVSAVKEV